MARTSVNIQSGAFVNNAAPISDQYFGGNILFDRDRVGEDGTFDEKAAALNLGLIRYPGGNVTELYFDINDPEKTVEPDGHSGGLLPLSEFLAYIDDAGVKGALVLPTVTYMDALATGEMTAGEVRAEMRAFLTRLKAGEYGDPSAIEHFEIGNEYYGYEKFYDWSAPEQYAELAPLWAQELRSVFGDQAKISVQGGSNADDNALFIDAFSGKGHLIDSVIYHSYPWNLSQVYNHDNWKNWLWSQWEDAGLTETIFVSEWGISSQRFDSSGAPIGADRIEDGLARAIAMVEMTALQIQSGVDFATVWPVQQNTRGDLAGNEGQTAENASHVLSEDGLTLAGEAFQMMSEILPGMRLLDIGGPIDLDGKAEQDREQPELLLRAYEDHEKVVLFVSAWALDDTIGSAAVTLQLNEQYERAEVTTLTVAGEAYQDPNADPVTFTETLETVPENLTVTFTRDYELRRIVLEKGPKRGESSTAPDTRFQTMERTIVGDEGADYLEGANERDGVFGAGGDDRLYGHGDSDQLEGGAGADWLYGGAGFDYLRGGGGVDHLFGGSGTDLLSGSGASDFLKGQGGEDTLRGGSGDDTIIAGRQDDEVVGGNGDDLIKGGGGEDDLVGKSGDDRIYGAAGDDVIYGGGGADRLYGGNGADTLEGGAGDDVIEVGPGADIARGGAGADTFVIRRSSEDVLIEDFEPGVDMLLFGHLARMDDLTFLRDGGSTVISADDVQLTLANVRPAELSDDDFLF